ncbi:uncharacterized protein LOC122274585 [Carya illinoinensis]|uniref:uncharacterized protein LOC122274585 n=1 Tax=Carya illinoinensis TaxID=32201 RepID=UPI001C71926E|nr:uncharacterized protein LOC122274585 [Carya illinoinensis]
MKGELRGVAISRGGIRINHLLFADDSVIFGRVSIAELKRIQGLLDIYGKALGKCLNEKKITIFLSSNTHWGVRTQIQQGAGVAICGSYEKYLRLPAVVGRSRYYTFRSLKERVWAKVNSWKNNFLSQAGKEILLKAVVQVIPTYSMSVFRLPIRLCKDISSVMSRFWWVHMKNDKRIQWRRELMQAKIGFGPSMIWRSLWYAISLIKEGVA